MKKKTNTAHAQHAVKNKAVKTDQRRDDPAPGDMITPNAAGIDGHREEMWVGVPADRAERNVVSFGADTGDLDAMAACLSTCRISSVALASTGVDWIPLDQVVEARGFTGCLTHARHLTSIAGRPKTDTSWMVSGFNACPAMGCYRRPFGPMRPSVSFGRFSDTAPRSCRRPVVPCSICRTPETR